MCNVNSEWNEGQPGDPKNETTKEKCKCVFVFPTNLGEQNIR